MKESLKHIFLLCGLASFQTQAMTISGIENINALVDTVTGSTGNILNWQSVTAADTINPMLNSDLTDASETTYVLSIDSSATIDMAFNSNDIFNGAGADLVFFFAGANDFTFGLDIDADGTNTAQTFSAELTGFGFTDALNRTWNISAAKVDLDMFGFSADQKLESDFRVIIGDDYGRPALSLIGGFHTSATAVPLPLPIVLMASGLGVLGFFTRRSKS